MTEYPKSSMRRLKVYAFDPQASVSLSTAMANDYGVELPWEERWKSAQARPGQRLCRGDRLGDVKIEGPEELRSVMRERLELARRAVCGPRLTEQICRQAVSFGKQGRHAEICPFPR